jgi:phosphotransferase system HPr (HPr) family protein
MKLVKTFRSEVRLVTPKGEVGCRSIVGLLGAAIKQGTAVEVRVEGPDEAEALIRIVEFLDGLVE